MIVSDNNHRSDFDTLLFLFPGLIDVGMQGITHYLDFTL